MDVPIFDKTPKSNVCFPLFTVIILSITIYASNYNIYACFYLLYSLGSHNFVFPPTLHFLYIIIFGMLFIVVSVVD
jgi:hypothetical protein